MIGVYYFVVQDYVVKWKMKFNGKMSSAMFVGKGGDGLKWSINGAELEVVLAFSYVS